MIDRPPATGQPDLRTGGRSRAPAAIGRPAAATRLGRLVPWALAAAAVLAQVAYPLVERFETTHPATGPGGAGGVLRGLTVATVLLFCAASVTHALATRGAAWTATLVAVTAGGGLLAEAVGVATGWPFGGYTYAGTLGPQLLGVPVLIPLAWTMLAYPAFLVARRLTRRFVPLVGGVGLASWDLFLDPQMVAAGHWRWADPIPALPGIPGIPVSNFAGWLLVATVMMAILDRFLAEQPATVTPSQDMVPSLLYLWTYASSVLGNAVFFGRPTVALVGGVVMGLVAVPFALRLRSSRQ